MSEQNVLNIDSDYMEQCLVKGLLEDTQYLVSVISVFEKDYFDNPEVQQIFTTVNNHFKEYKEVPDRSILLNTIAPDARDQVRVYLDHVDSIDLDLARHHEWLYNQTDAYLRDKAIKDAIRRSVDVIDGGNSTYEIKELVEQALCKSMDTNLGLNYFDELGSRLTRMFTDETHRLKTYFPMFDDFINGGFPPKTLSVFVAKIHGFKSNVMANMIARMVLNGQNIALASLEMSEDMFAQRFDGIYTQLDINRIYFNEQLKADLVRRLREVKNQEGRGQLYIKSFPTGKASVNDFRAWVRELKMRGIELNGFFFDYLNLMKSAENADGNGTYGSVKSIAEETRAMGFEFNIPMISVSQLNRTGTFMRFEDVDFNSIAESMGVPATADFMMIMGANDEGMVYQNEVHYKIVKNRLGGRVGEMDKFFYDARSMKMYCSSELDLWMHDIEYSGDQRDVHQYTDD